MQRYVILRTISSSEFVYPASASPYRFIQTRVANCMEIGFLVKGKDKFFDAYT